MAATRFYVPQMTKAKSDTAITEFALKCLQGLDSNPDTYEIAAKTTPTIQIDMDATSGGSSYPWGGATPDNPGINFAGVWLGPRLGGWAGTGSLTVQAGTSYAGAATVGSINTTALGNDGRLLIAEFSLSLVRYWKLVFSFSVAPSVREIFIGSYRDMTARWDWGGVPRGLRSMAAQDELRGGHVLSRLERQKMPIRTERSYEYLSEADKLVIENAYEGAKGNHSLIIVSDDGTSAYNGGMVCRFGDVDVPASPPAHQLWNVGYALIGAPVIGDLDIY